MKSRKIEKILSDIFSKKYPELEFECEVENHQIMVFTYYKIYCRGPREFFNSEKFNRKDIETEIRVMLKMMGIFDEVRVYFEYND